MKLTQSPAFICQCFKRDGREVDYGVCGGGLGALLPDQGELYWTKHGKVYGFGACFSCCLDQRE
ncbi:hypothetical protein [Bradyrhizobium sp. STM 3562]|uniref:hypothetical protein n=1 Tax=Bradyrhizobium sp. STM 3562 TaxID=578924 RepID=UPI00388F4784